MTKTYLTVNGRPLGFLSPRDEEVFTAGKIAALADLRARVDALPLLSLYQSPAVNLASVLALIDGLAEKA